MTNHNLFGISMIVGCSILSGCDTPPPGGTARDPGPRSVGMSEAEPIENLSDAEKKLFDAGKDEFLKVDKVKDDGLGPTFNLDSCVGCHIHPAAGGSSPPPPNNPQAAMLKDGTRKGNNVLPPFITEDGPVREARLKKNPGTDTDDGGVHALFSIAGLPGADGCDLHQEDFTGENATHNIVFRIPTPTFGVGLIEAIPDQAIVNNHEAASKNPYNIKPFLMKGKLNIVSAGNTKVERQNRNGNDGTIARFGWKAQNKSLLVFSGEAYNVEMGVTNELFPTEREEKPDCHFKPAPNDKSHPENSGIEAYSDIEKFAAFMRFLAPPKPSTDTPGGAHSIARGREVFTEIGCAHCHTPTMQTGDSSFDALRNKPVHLYSDLALHDMGSELEDGIKQGQAEGRDFRTAPLWGLGQRIFFLHDGRTSDLVQAIEAHASKHGTESEGDVVVKNYLALSEEHKQNLLNFLRSL
jgi:CxxC motif-containing protein (DUF1111 family)